MISKPNILFIVSDQHNAKVTGYNNHPDVKTPHLDRMAEEGVRFNNCVTQSPICTPSRVSFLSGQYCHNHGYYGLHGQNPSGLPNIFTHLRAYGYKTAAIGKIHCPEYWVEDACDIFEDSTGTSVGGRSKKYTQFLKERGKLELEDHGDLPEFGDKGRQSVEGRPSPLTFEESQEGWCANEAVNFMKKMSEQSNPFLLHVSFPRPHQCTTPSQEFWDLYETNRLTLPPNTDYDMEEALKSPHLIQTSEDWRTRDWALFEPRTFEAARLRKQHGYLGAVSQVDAAVGVLLNFLRESGLDKNTIVIYTSDHGDYATEHNVMEKAPGICSDAITRVPHIWWSPERFKSGHISDEVIELIDVSQTICSLAGLSTLETSDGKDISPLLQGDEQEIHQIGVTEFVWGKSVRKANFRLVYYPREMFPDEYPNGFGELYDLDADPWEMKNLYFDDRYGHIVQQLQSELLNWLITSTRPGTVHGVNSGPFPFSESPQTMVRYKTVINMDGKINPDLIQQSATKNYL
ncbi:MAG: sulfatase-like hydrolase/transferase [Aggregatilineales bacterium]